MFCGAQDAFEILGREALHLHLDRHTTLQLDRQVGGFRILEGSRPYEQNVPGVDFVPYTSLILTFALLVLTDI